MNNDFATKSRYPMAFYSPAYLFEILVLLILNGIANIPRRDSRLALVEVPRELRLGALGLLEGVLHVDQISADAHEGRTRRHGVDEIDGRHGVFRFGVPVLVAGRDAELESGSREVRK